jgi:two-component system sensor histidine kinase VicK
LGLAIARALVQAHGGEIALESELGHGSSVWFTVPLAAES